MSYSFSARGKNAEAALADVAQKMSEVVTGQPVHAKDQQLVNATAKEAAGLLAPDETKDVSFSLSGHVGYSAWDTLQAQLDSINSVSLSVSVGYVNRE